jgi:hypothetical protein
LGGGGNAAYSSLDNIISQDDIIDFLTAPKEGRRLFHVDQDGNAIAPGEQKPMVSKVVEIDPAKSVDKVGKPVDL